MRWLLACPFRIFFLLTGLQAVVIVALWLGQLTGTLMLPVNIPIFAWHAREMLFGFVGAAIAGFLLTAICQWTGCRPVAGARLAALAGLWLLGRLVVLSPFSPWATLITDALFWTVLAGYVGVIIERHGNRRNRIMLVLLAVMLGASLLFHLGVVAEQPLLARHGQLLALAVIVMLMAVIGGRITPLFTANWLRRAGRGGDDIVKPLPLEIAFLVSVAVTLLLAVAGMPGGVPAAIAGLAVILGTVRLICWRGWWAWREPLLWILHTGQIWILAGLGLFGLSRIAVGIPDTAWIHALSAGAMGSLILGVMSRVALGHTGRPLVLPSGMTAAFVLVVAAGVSRVVTALGVLSPVTGWTVSVVAWAIAYGVFLVAYIPILIRPRVDGREG